MNQINYAVVTKLILSIFLLMVFPVANADRDDDTPVLDVDASGTVTPLTDGLIILRSMFGFTDDALTNAAVDLTNCQDCDSDEIEKYIADVRGLTFGKINSVDDQNISGSVLNGTTLTIGIENGDSESVDLSGLLDGVGVTSSQASAITANTAKTGITSDQASAITANTAKTGITSDQASAITANTAKTGITSDQADAITANTAKTGVTSDQANAITANTSKTGITSDQADAITANTAKTGITSDQASAIVANTAKTGITSDQASAIASNSSDGFWAINFIHATGSDSDFSSEGTRYYQIYASRTMTVSKLIVKGSNANAAATIIGGIYRGTLGSSTTAGGTLIGQGSRTSVDGLNEISLTAESGENLNITGFEPLIIALHVKTTSDQNNAKQYFSPEVYAITGDKAGISVSRTKNVSLSSLPSSPGGGESLGNWNGAKGFVAYIN